ncbi:uncharacterized protein LOC144589620 isoform X2 [Pogona vitticeps]
MNLLRAVRPLLAARLRQAAPLRGKVSFRNKAEREIVLSPTTAFVCYAFSAVFGSVLIYGAYYFIVQANARDVQRAAYFERVGLSEWKPRPWPPPE